MCILSIKASIEFILEDLVDATLSMYTFHVYI